MAFDLQDDDEEEEGPAHLANSLLRNRHMRRAVFHAQPWLSNLRYNHLKGKRRKIRSVTRCMPRR